MKHSIPLLLGLVIGCGSSVSGDGNLSSLADRDTLASGPIVGLAGKCLDISGARAADGTPVQLWDCNGTDAQNWTYDGHSLSALNGYCLDIPGNRQHAGARLQIWQCNGSRAQTFTVDGSTIKSTRGYCVDITGDVSTDGTRAELWPCNGQDNQSWSWQETAPADPTPPTASTPPATNPPATNPPATTPPPATLPPTPSNGLPYMIGYKSDGNPNAPTTMRSWLGRPIDIVGTTITTTNWTWPDSNGPYTDNVVLNVSFPIVSGWDGGDAGGYTDMAKAADGSYDAVYTAMAQNLAGLPNKTAVVAIGWEMTGGWYPWSIGVGTNATGANYIAAFKRIATIIKTYNPNALVEFCTAWGGGPFEDYWPGAYDPNTNPGGVDVMSMDVYEANVTYWNNGGNPITWASVTSNVGLQSPGWHTLDSMVSFAQANGVKIGMREWAAGGPGLDDGQFVADALAWMNSFPAGFFIYNLYSDDSPADDLLTPGVSPKEQQAWINAYSGTQFTGTWWHGGQ